MSNSPVKKFRVGNITAAIFENEGTGDNKFFTVNLNRSYKNGDDWQNTSSLNSGDLLNAVKVLERSEHWIAQQQ